MFQLSGFYSRDLKLESAGILRQRDEDARDIGPGCSARLKDQMT